MDEFLTDVERTELHQLLEQMRGHLAQYDGERARQTCEVVIAKLERLIEQQPEAHPLADLLAGMHDNIGNIAARNQSTAAAEAAFRRALPIRKSLVASHPKQAAYRHRLALTHAQLGTVLIGTHQYAKADESLDAAIQLLQRLSDTETNPKIQHDLAQAYFNRGYIGEALRRGNQAVESYVQAQTVLEGLIEQYPKQPDYRFDLARAHSNLSQIFQQMRRLPEAIEQAERAVARFDELHRLKPDEAAFATAHLRALETLFSLTIAQPPLDRAKEIYQQLTRIRQQRMQSMADRTEEEFALGLTTLQWASALHDQKQLSDAAEQYDLASEQLARLAGRGGTAQHRHVYASTLFDRGICFADLGRPDASEESYRRAERVWEHLREEYPQERAFTSRYAGTLNHRGILNQNTGRPHRAITLYEASLAVRTEWGQSHPDDADNALYLAGTQCNLGHTLRQLGQLESAAEQYRESERRLLALRETPAAGPRLDAFLKNVHDGLAALQSPQPPSLQKLHSATVQVSRPAGPQPLWRAHAYRGYEAIRTAVDHDDFPNAIRQLDAILAADDSHVQARLDRADLLRAMGRAEDALADLNRLHDARPDEAEPWFLRGLVLARFCEPKEGGLSPLDDDALDQAIEAFDEALILDPQQSRYRYWKGLAHEIAAHAAQSRVRAQFAAFEKLHGGEVAREWVQPAINRFRCEFQRARESFEAALRLQPDDGEAWYALGRLLVDLEPGHELDARKAFRQAVQFRPTLPHPWLELAKLADAAGERELARDCLTQLLRLDASYRGTVHRLFPWLDATA
ncbi:tetratricopeptide tpr_1 repeat-containing protein : Uncharacterized protein OS=Methanosarcina acetivorans (strain ATCC 35395 / DSM 2834 / JCM 12185 / C2A) GN=MA_3293 PE=4 SV=1: TPR_10: TPR_10: TPR_1: TPR_10: TPR_8: TPR_16 [Tuwongella immobilis]|uniref:Tetratricopeptide repeat protein n=2 Tax=Tuwongella immobilis TaxID=692036 RepID=A0A6C2YJV0_9BACT|nr:tetratricopeptide tpr_1 repeat-containing protein : Uncharacterized protein OS=Methanosarcina acetivorans (strain ATCC 35395 / DSM 2834 / JCM 12185 / C2A) GN=MA_3293 PE=4 SV=1: TPR_10: TPR_10: TPR_1: TPR_10: TPR_8: TPR_16 [Tuwongella immobilis]VTR98242.1 tetratricopeptide tpr_1 repeat-containing protein : Uncharacterized protein OS=Methanosarcina acetivorans (strain ATCC 35395 / DSM 2834 / JCM 12185 / C2A) GN=MA_3293 PE=4 SV=1: TPR_10: TPR_10: TPR_1: TPR_10: TPR_8: TPR_16 [Tuwongella immobilis]